MRAGNERGVKIIADRCRTTTKIMYFEIVINWIGGST